MHSLDWDVIIRTIHTAFEVSGTDEDLWIAFLLKNHRICYMCRRRWLDYQDDLEKSASVCLSCAFSAVAMLKPVISLLSKTFLTRPSVDILSCFGNSFLGISLDYLLIALSEILNKYNKQTALNNFCWIYKYLILRLLKQDYMKKDP